MLFFGTQRGEISHQNQRGDRPFYTYCGFLPDSTHRILPTLREIKHIINTVRHDLVNAANYYNWAYTSHPERLRSLIFCIIGTEDAATRNYETRFQEWG